MTIFYAVGAWHRGESLRVARNFKFIKKAKCDYGRSLGQVGWPGEEIDPFWSDYKSTFGSVIDCAWDEGIRLQITAIGGWPKDRRPKSGQGPIECAFEMAQVIEPRKHKIILLESVNEGNASEEDAASIGRIFGQLGIPFGVGLGNQGLDDINQAGRKCHANASFYHTSRTFGDDSESGGKLARMVRQCWDFQKLDGVRVDNEPAGIASSVNVLTDPVVMAGKRAANIVCGAAVTCIHPGAGVFGRYFTGSWGIRHANLDEVPGLLEMAHMTKNAENHLPEGIENWNQFNTDKPINIANGKCNKIYGARNGNQFVEIVIGAEGVTALRKDKPCNVKMIVNPAAGEIVENVSNLPYFVIIGED